MATAPRASAKVVPLDDAGKASASKSNKTLLIAALAGVLLAGAGAAAAWYFVNASGNEENAYESIAIRPPVFVPLEPFTVNLQPEGMEQYLQVALTMQVADGAQTELIKQYMPLLRSRILMLLTSKKASELSTTEGKEKLQQEIAAAASKPFVANSRPIDVSAVLFTSFVIQ